MTELLSSFHSTSSTATANTRATITADELLHGVPATHHPHTTTTATTTASSTSSAKRVMGSSPLPLREEGAAATQQQRQAAMMTGENSNNNSSPNGAAAGPSPPLPYSKDEGDRSGRQRKRQVLSPRSDVHTPPRGGEGSRNSSIVSKDSTTPQRAAGGAPPLLPVISGAATAATDPPGSLSAAAGQPPLSPDYSARRQRRPSTNGSARDAPIHPAGMNTSCDSFSLSPMRSTRDISATGLRGPIPENAHFATALQSPMSHSRTSRPTPTPMVASHAATTTAEEGRRGSAEAPPLPPLTRSLVSLSSSSQSRRMTGNLLEGSAAAAAAAAATVAATGAAMSRSSSMNSVRRDDEGPRQASLSAVVTEGAVAAAQPPPPPPPAPPSSTTAAGFAPSPPPPFVTNAASIERAFHGFVTGGGGGSSGPDDLDERLPTNRFVDEDSDAYTNQQGSPLGLTEQEEATFSMVPVITTEADPHGAPPSSAALTTTGLGGSHVSLPTAEVRAAASSAVHEAGVALLSSSSLLKNGSGDQDYVAAATAARGATEARRLSDSVTEAADPKAAKRHLKKERKAKKAKHDAAADVSKHVHRSDDAAVAVAAAHRSDSELQRKRQRKKQEKQAKLKAMSTEEQRKYKAEHQRRRAAKKALRSSNGATPAVEAEATVLKTDEKDNGPNTSPPPSNAQASSTFGATQPPLSVTPETPNLDRSEGDSSSKRKDGNDSDAGAAATLNVTLSTPQLASTARPTLDDHAGGATLLQALNQMRRCTSAKGPTVPLTALSAAPPHGTSSASRNFRRRFLSEATLTSTPQYRANGFLCVPTDEGAAEQPPPELQVDSPRDGARGFDDDDDDDNTLLAPQAMYGSAASEASLKESVLMSPTAVPFIAPHPPAAAAGSGAAAILELKQQQQQQQQPQPPMLTSPVSVNSVAHNGDDAHHHHHDDDAEVRDRLATGVTAPSQQPRQQSVHVSAASSVSFHAEPPVTPSAAGGGLHAAMEEASHSVNPDSDDDAAESGDEKAGGQTQHHPARPTQPRDAASPSSLSYYSYSRSRDGSAQSLRVLSDYGQRTGAAAAVVEAHAGSDATTKQPGVAPAVVGVPRRRLSPASSCSSFRSRSGDDDSDVGGSSSYSYSYSSSTGSGSSSGSVGSVVAEVLPLKEGCATLPPSAAFHDLQYRYGCVAQLQAYAEPAVIHEWNLTEGCWGSVETSVVLNPQPFSKGNMRASYYMIDMRRLNCMLVAKRYLKSSVGEDQYFDDVSMHSISGHWARVFNAMHPPKKVRFVPAAVLVLPKRSPPLILAMEPLLTGKFVKYNNNCGYVRRNARWTPQAFSHFTYEASHHELMVVDIQGVDDYYTDPQILSPDGEGYGRGNLGKKGIRRFLESHKCNDVCRAVGLPPLRRNSNGVVVSPPMSAKLPHSNPLPATPGALERLAAASSLSGLREERLPPKMFTISTQGPSSNAHGGSERSPLLSNSGHSAYGGNGVHTRVGSLADGSRPGSEAGKLGSPPPQPHGAHHHGSGHPSPIPAAVLKGPSGYGGAGAAGPGGNAGAINNGNGVSVGPPSLGYGVKYMAYPRQAMVRPQSQYFTSTVAGGLMAVPPSGNSPSANGTPSTPALHMANGVPGAAQQQAQQQQQQSQQPPHSPAPLNGVVVSAVPLLRPPTVGRPGGSGGGGGSGYQRNSPTTGCNDGFVSVAAQKAGSSAVGLTNSPQLEPASGPVPALYPHPPKSRLSSLGGLSTGTPKPSSLNGGLQSISHTNSSIAVVPVVQTTQEAQMMGGPHTRRQSFSRRPVLSAVEEKPKSKSRRHHHHQS